MLFPMCFYYGQLFSGLIDTKHYNLSVVLISKPVNQSLSLIKRATGWR